MCEMVLIDKEQLQSECSPIFYRHILFFEMLVYQEYNNLAAMEVGYTSAQRCISSYLDISSRKSSCFKIATGREGKQFACRLIDHFSFCA